MTNKFPDNFLWGAAMSAHQVEGDNFYNDWWEWEQAGHTEPSGKACDHYHRFKEDFRIAKELQHNAHRLSIEWSRLEKKEGVWDAQEWDHYKEVVDELLRLKIEPIVTLNHFTLPLWLARKGGWKNDDIIRLFSRFAGKAVQELGDRAEYWITINEPLILAFIAYSQGRWPPCARGSDDEIYVIKNMLKAHVAAYQKMHEISKTITGVKALKVGIAKAVTTFHPCSKYSALDRIATFLRQRSWNHSFINSAKKSLDFIGLNYYFREFVHHKKPIAKNPFGWICSRVHHEDAGRRTTVGWEIYPVGLYEVAKNFSRYKIPIIITENGLSTYDDTLRQEFIKEHLLYLLKAIEEGAPVKGYLHWSLLDNFEWSEGYGPKFGLIEVDYKTQKRTIKPSARYLASIIKAGQVL